ncbi:MAG TPA: flagellar biosynthesis protein FlhA, partial [Candidatus Sulfotelmatobacter sp.]|nr:flagellar biosynthesis protein FlhA [Candidatus Sulfotelmatobacter sp.]
DVTLGGDIGHQVFSRPRVLWITAGVMAALGFIPGLPKFSFFLLAAASAYLARRARQSSKPAEAAGTPVMPGAPLTPGAKPVESLEAMLKLDDLSLEVGFGLVPLVDAKQGGQLLQRVRALRSNLALQMGFIVPPVHITDNLRLNPREYVVSLRGVEVARWEMKENHLLAISSDVTPPALAGTPTREPAFGVNALWIEPSLQNQALAAGYAVVDQTSVIATHLAEVIRQFAHELLSRQETKRLLDRLAESHPKLIEELVPKILSLGEVQKVLQQLLRELVSIRDLATILETLLDTAAVSKNPVHLVEAARQALGRALVRPLLGADGGLRVVTLDTSIEEELGHAFSAQLPATVTAQLQPSFVRRLLEGLRALAGDQVALATPVLLCGTPARFHLRRLLEPFLPRLVVLSPAEIPPTITVQAVGTVR